MVTLEVAQLCVQQEAKAKVQAEVKAEAETKAEEGRSYSTQSATRDKLHSLQPTLPVNSTAHTHLFDYVNVSHCTPLPPLKHVPLSPGPLTPSAPARHLL